MKKAFLILCVLVLCAVAGCSPSGGVSATPEVASPPQSAPAPAASTPVSTPSPAPTAQAHAGADARLVPYANEEFKVAMSFPADWEAPYESIDEDGLMVSASASDFSMMIYLCAQVIDPALPTLEDYEAETISLYKEMFATAEITAGMLPLAGMDFLRLAIRNTELEVVQFVYAVYANELLYEITISLDAPLHDEFEPLMAEVVKSIAVL